MNKPIDYPEVPSKIKRFLYAPRETKRYSPSSLKNIKRVNVEIKKIRNFYLIYPVYFDGQKWKEFKVVSIPYVCRVVELTSYMLTMKRIKLIKQEWMRWLKTLIKINRSKATVFSPPKKKKVEKKKYQKKEDEPIIPIEVFVEPDDEDEDELDDIEEGEQDE